MKRDVSENIILRNFIKLLVERALKRHRSHPRRNELAAMIYEANFLHTHSDRPDLENNCQRTQLKLHKKPEISVALAACVST